MSLLAFMLARQPASTEEQQPGAAPDEYGDAIAAISGLVSWWRWGEAAGTAVAVDEQGVQNGLYQTSVSLGHAALMSDTGNTGMRLNGTSGFVDITDQAGLHLATGTMAVWFQPDSLASDRYILSKAGAGIVQGDLELWYRQLDDSFRFGIEDGATVQRATSGGILPTGVLDANGVYCAIIQWGTGGMKLHLAANGARSLLGTNAYTGGLTSNTKSLRIGASQFSGVPGQFFDGGIDDVMIWNRQLSESELNIVGQASTVVTEPGLIDFTDNNSTRYYSIPHADALDFPTGIGAWGFWTRVDDNAGTASQFALSSGVDTNVPSLGVYLAEASNSGTTPNAFGFHICGNGGVGGSTLRPSSVVTGADSVQRLVVVQSTGSLVQMWLCPRSGTATKVYEAAVTIGGLNPTIEWNFGRRSDGNTARYWEEWLGGLFKSNIALSQAQIEQIATGLEPTTVLGANCAAFWRFQNGMAATELDVVGGIVATRRDAVVGTFGGFYQIKHTFNTPIPAGHPTLAPRASSTVAGQTCTSAEFVSDIATEVDAGTSVVGAFLAAKGSTDWGWPVRFASASDPLLTFRSSGSRYADPAAWEHYIANGWNLVRWPAGARPMTGSDREIGIVDPTRSFITEFFLCNYPTLTTAVCRRWYLNQVPYAQPWDGLGSASLCPYAKTASVMLYDEVVVQKRIPHALAFAYTFPADSIVNNNNSLFPCVRTFNHKGTRVCCAFNGMRFQYDVNADPDVECAGVQSVYRNSCKVVLKCMQEFGFFLVDGSQDPAIYQENLNNQVGETRNWEDPDNRAIGYGVPLTGYELLKGLSWSKVRAVEPIRP